MMRGGIWSKDGHKSVYKPTERTNERMSILTSPISTKDVVKKNGRNKERRNGGLMNINKEARSVDQFHQ